jgi:hypothetical protein
MFRQVADGVLLMLAENPGAFPTRFNRVAEVLQRRADALSFDARWYAAAYPDAVAAVEAGVFTDLREHFREQGVLCGRIGTPMRVEEAWYLDAYPEAAAAIASNKFADASEHFRQKGFFEGCAASPRHLVDEAWYRTRYPLVENEIELGYYSSLQDHYNRIGYGLGLRASHLG